MGLVNTAVRLDGELKAKREKKAPRAPARLKRPEDSPDYPILDEVARFMEIYLVADRAQVDAMVLYAAATHGLAAFPTFGRMLFTSLDEASGKTRAMEVTAALCANPQDASGTPYSLQSELAAAANEPERAIPSFYYDEIGGVYGSSGLNRGGNRILDDVLKKGYRAGAAASWSVNRTKQSFSVFSPFLMTGLRTSIPRDIRSRTIVIQMSQGTPKRYFDVREAQPKAEELADSLSSHVKAKMAELTEFRAQGIHPRLKDRRLEVWESLFAIAWVLGGQEWLNRCKNAFAELSLDQVDHVLPSPRQRILKQAAGLLGSMDLMMLPNGREFVSGKALATEMHRELMRQDLPEDKIPTVTGVAMSISDAMEPVEPRQIRIGKDRYRGYYADDILGTWEAIRPEEPEDADIPVLADPFDVTTCHDLDSEEVFEIPGSPAMSRPSRPRSAQK